MSQLNTNPNASETDTNPETFGAPIQVTSTPTFDGSLPTVETLGVPAAAHAAEPTPVANPGSPATGVGLDGEQEVWSARYSMRNFSGRLVFRSLLTLLVVVLAVMTWRPNGNTQWMPLTLLFGLAALVLWTLLFHRMVHARYGHSYRLTNRRLFTSTGLMRRRVDQMELIHLKDVYTRQTLMERWMSLGTVVVVSSEKETPVFYLTGVDHPKTVMDVIWHHARAERDNRVAKVESV